MQSSRFTKLIPLAVIMMCIVMNPFMLNANTIHQDVDETLLTLSAINTAFAVDFFMELAYEAEGNFVFSPYSLSNAFAMTYAGARENTAQQMQDIFRFNLLSAVQLHRAFSGLNILLNDDTRTSKIIVANAVWGEQTFQFAPDYQQLIITNYANGFRMVDFKSAPDTARQEINQWVNQQTDGRISELVPSGAVDALTRLILTNAVLFKADWLFPFDSNLTADAPFYTPDGVVDVPMMNASEMGFQCIGKEDDYDFDYVAIRLRYADERASFVIIMPDEKAYDRFFDEFTGEAFEEVLDSLSGCFGKIFMPRFSISSNINVKPLLMEMGMVDAFGASADFAGISSAPELYISDAFHQATIDVTEKGTEAAAASAVIMGVRSGGAVELVIDSPFVFAILDDETDTILFMGLVTNPLGN